MLWWRVPAPGLTPFIRVLWYAEGWQPASGRERYMPDGRAAILIVLDDFACGNSDDCAIVTGPRSSSFIGASARRTMIGVHFRSGGAGPFLDIPVSELVDTHVPLRYAADPGAAILRERLMVGGSPEARLDVLERWLMQRLLRRRHRDQAIAWAVRMIERRPNVRMHDIAARIGRSSRWFIDRFASEVGLTPKTFSRVRRFQAAVGLMHARSGIDFADLALSLGYADQAHFSHEFRAIGGITPTAYLAGRTAHPNHVAVAD